jgi:diphthine synthase
MVLYLIGLGLSDEKDISVRGLETVKNCSFAYLEGYTSKLRCSVSDLSRFLGKEVVLADRELVEKKADEILDKAKDQDVAFLVVGDPMCATTHIDMFLRAKEKSVRVEVIHNASILSAIGEVGLEVYKYGKVTSIPFMIKDNQELRTPVEVYSMNNANGLHTLFLLDLDPINQKFMGIKEASDYLIDKGVSEEVVAVGCARIGSLDRVIKVGKLKEIGDHSYGEAPYCLVVPGKMHFMEEDALKYWQ